MRISPITFLGAGLAAATTFCVISGVLQECAATSRKENDATIIEASKRKRKLQQKLLKQVKIFLSKPTSTIRISPQKAEKFLKTIAPFTSTGPVERKMKKAFFTSGLRRKSNRSPADIRFYAMHRHAAGINNK